MSESSLAKTLNLGKKTPREDWQSLFTWIENYLHYSVNTTHPNFNNRMWSGANLPSILGEIITALYNTSSCTYESAPVASLMEKYMIDEMLKLVGFPQGEGLMTTGSSHANMIAMMLARNKNIPKSKELGLFQQKPLFAFVSSDAHYSFDKAANVLGIGTHQLIKIKTNTLGQINSDALDLEIKRIIKKGGKPFFIGATLGTTVRGAFDSISNLIPIKEKYNLWLHGDGAWGGSVIVNDALKEKFLKNIYRLDSFTTDFHKMLGSALMCNFLLISHKNLLNRVCSAGNINYIFHKSFDLGVNSLQCGRRVDSLKWFLDWKFFGKEGFSTRISYYYQLICYAEKKIAAHPQLFSVVKRTSFNVCFRFLPSVKIKLQTANALNQEIRSELQKRELSLLSIAFIDDIFIFRLLIANTKVTTKTIDDLLDNISKIGNELWIQ